MKRTHFWAIGLALLTVLGLATGCGRSSSATTSRQKTHVVTDMTGKKVTVPTRVTRVADLWHANNQVVLLLGGQRRLVATTQLIKQSPWFQTVNPRIKHVTAPFAGDDLQIEELLKTKPDVVIAADEAQVKKARSAKLPTVNAMYQDFAGLRKSVTLTAKVLGGTAPKVADAYQRTLTRNLNTVKRRLRGVTAKPKVLHIVNATNLNQVDGRGTIVDEWIKAAGGQNALKQSGNMISVTTEQLAKANPDVIIVGSTTTAKAQRALRQNPVLRKLTAVKHGRVYGNPQGTFPWDRYSAEEALQVLWAAKKLHPAQFRGLNMVSETQAFYQKYYHYHLSQTQAQQMLNGK